MKTEPLGNFRHRSTLVRQRGVAIISAIFLLLLFAALAAFMVSLTGTANITSAQDVQGSRAYQSAQAGLEWGLYQVLAPVAPSCTASTTLPSLIEDLYSGRTLYRRGAGIFAVSTGLNGANPGRHGWLDRFC